MNEQPMRIIQYRNMTNDNLVVAMQVMVTFPDGHVFPADVSDDMELENFLALCQVESTQLRNLDIGRLTMFFQGQFYSDKKQTLKAIGVKHGDMVMVQVQRPNLVAPAGPQAITGLDFSSIRLPTRQSQSNSTNNDSPEQIARTLLSNPNLLAALRQNNPPLAQALDTGDITRFTQMIGEARRAQIEEIERRRRILSNPFDPEAQRLLEEDIRRRHVEENMEIAIEHTPESFGYVHMLYIRCKVNGHEVKAFVDSGAQSTIMSESLARTCNVTRLIDHRFQGIAKGVGTSKIVGRIHLAQLQIGNDYLPTSFMVLEDQSVDMLLGLDMLKRHQCVIDLKNNKLVIGTTGGATEFLPENELPASARHSGSFNDEDTGLNEAIAKSLNEKPDQTSASSSVAGAANPNSAPSVAVASPQETEISKLTAMGFPRDDVIQALRSSGGNADAAAARLIVKFLPTPKTAKK